MSCNKWQIIYIKKSISLLKILVFYMDFYFFCKVTIHQHFYSTSGTIWSCGQMSCDKWQIIYLKKVHFTLKNISVLYGFLFFFVK